MDYKKIYDKFMSDRLAKKRDRLLQKKAGMYFEGHHIIPKCKGGTGNSNRPKYNPNIVLLTAREHFLAHRLLWKIYGDRQMALAFHKMLSSSKNTNRKFTARQYAVAREAFAITNIGNTYGKGVTKVISEEQRRRHSEFMKGRGLGELNVSKRPEVRKKISEKLKGKKKSKEHVEKMRIATKNHPKLTCPHCGVVANKGNALRWHFDRCSVIKNKL
jgi:hypothetical protein